jgi:hypothetical protein
VSTADDRGAAAGDAENGGGSTSPREKRPRTHRRVQGLSRLRANSPKKLNYRNATAAWPAALLSALAQPGALLAQPVQVGRGT